MIDFIKRIQSLHVGMQPPGSSVTRTKEINVGICWAKSLTGFKLDTTYAKIMQHSPTRCTNERNMLCPTLWRNMLRPGAPLAYFNDGGGGGVRVIFLGLKFWPKMFFLGAYEVRRDFLGLEKIQRVFWGL